MVLDIIIITITALLILGGIIGSVVPIIPGPVLVLVGAVVYAWHTDFTVVSWTVLAVLAVLAILSQVLDYVASVFGAGKYGASKWGLAGAFIGGIVGIFFGGIIGIIIGPFIGAVVFELFHGKTFAMSFKVGYGTLLGLLGGALGRLIIALIMAGVFVVSVWK